MREESRESSTRNHWRMKRVVGVVRVLYWRSAALTTLLVVLSWGVPGVGEEWSFNLLGTTCVGLAMVSSASLFWQELRANRQELRAVRQESRDISLEEGKEWTPKAWLHATALGLSFSLSWHMLPALFFSS
jgi:hypothetical protein